MPVACEGRRTVFPAVVSLPPKNRGEKPPETRLRSRATVPADSGHSVGLPFVIP